jgi:hypothetical protein
VSEGAILAPGLYLWFNHFLKGGSIVVKPKKTPLKKKGRGRPFEGGRDPIVGVRLPPAEIASLDAIADREGVKRSEMVRRLLLAGIAAYKPVKAPK